MGGGSMREGVVRGGAKRDRAGDVGKRPSAKRLRRDKRPRHDSSSSYEYPNSDAVDTPTLETTPPGHAHHHPPPPPPPPRPMLTQQFGRTVPGQPQQQLSMPRANAITSHAPTLRPLNQQSGLAGHPPRPQQPHRVPPGGAGGVPVSASVTPPLRASGQVVRGQPQINSPSPQGRVVMGHSQMTPPQAVQNVPSQHLLAATGGSVSSHGVPSSVQSMPSQQFLVAGSHVGGGESGNVSGHSVLPTAPQNVESAQDGGRASRLTDAASGMYATNPHLSVSAAGVHTPFRPGGYGTAVVSNSSSPHRPENPLPAPPPTNPSPLPHHLAPSIASSAASSSPHVGSLRSAPSHPAPPATPTSTVATPTSEEEPARLEFGQIRVKKEPGLNNSDGKETPPPKVRLAR